LNHLSVLRQYDTHNLNSRQDADKIVVATAAAAFLPLNTLWTRQRCPRAGNQKSMRSGVMSAD